MKDTFNPVLKEEISNYNNTYLRTYDLSKYYNIESFKPEPLDEREYFAEERAIRRRRRIRNRNKIIKAILLIIFIVIIFALIIVYVVLWVVCKGPTLPHCIK